MSRKYTAFQFRWPAALHERAVRIARAEHRSLNAQLLYWLENGGIPAGLLDETRADMVEAQIIGGGAA